MASPFSFHYHNLFFLLINSRTAVRNDTCAMAGVSLNMSARVHPVIWAMGGLPFDCLQAVPVQKPLGMFVNIPVS